MNRKLLLPALAVSTCLALIILVAGKWALAPQQMEPDATHPPGAGGVQFAPVPSADLEDIYHKAWVTLSREVLDSEQLAQAKWQDWEHKYDGKLRTDKQLREALTQLVASLGDRYMVVLSENELADFQVATSGKLVGIGVNLLGTQIYSVLPGSPAEKAGLQPGDVVTYVDGQPISPGATRKMMALLRGSGQAGTKLRVVVMRDKKPLRLDLTREVIRQIPSVRSNNGRPSFPFFGFGGFGLSAAARPRQADDPGANSEAETAKTGAVKIDNMRSDSLVAELEKALSDLDKEGMEGIVLDLRDLKGGSVETAARVAALFVSEGKLLTGLERADGKLVNITYAVESGKLTATTQCAGEPSAKTVIDTPVFICRKPVYVIVDRRTSGGSELIAAALRGKPHVTVFGEKTAGKGTGQKTIRLGRGLVVRATSARYSGPQAQVIDRAGVEPDVVADSTVGNFYGQAVLLLRDFVEKNRPKGTSKGEVKPGSGNVPGGEAKPDAGNAPKGEAKPDAGNAPKGEAKPDAGNAPKGEAKPDAGNAPKGEAKPDSSNAPKGLDKSGSGGGNATGNNKPAGGSQAP